ncbi:HalOD1 output domain-containing protein [Halorussus amylolyticus]|uniref:HalOD1 output domain-containing protein n=1 Tax=Halorussus amylolyticus TaxID=1126242 RepID=UPI00104475A5|nr:HalOD1 output domain-containing protein [Halorussus amylolyticus]
MVTEEIHSRSRTAAPTEDSEIRELTDGESITEAVTNALSSVLETETTSMEPLHSVVDTDALEAIFAPRGDGTPRKSGFVEFEYDSARVRVEGRTVVVYRPRVRNVSE